jgi:hypothetical protein
MCCVATSEDSWLTRACLIVCDLKTSAIRRPRPCLGCWATGKIMCVRTYVCTLYRLFTKDVHFIKYFDFDLLRFEVRPCPETLQCSCGKIIYFAHNGKQEEAILKMLMTIKINLLASSTECFCDGPIPCPEKSYQVCVCHWGWSVATITLYTYNE